MTLVNKMALPLIVTGIFLFLFCWSPLSRAAGTTDRGDMRFLPFNVQQAGDFKYLQDGAANMMACRVAEKAEVEIANWSAGADKLTTFWVSGQQDYFKQHIGESGTEYLLTGNLISRGQGLRLEIFVFDVASASLKGQFSAMAEDEGEILTVMEKLSRDIAERVFGRKEVVAAEEYETSQSSVVAQTPHPEKSYRDSLRSQDVESIVSDEIAVNSFADENAGRGIVLDVAVKDLDVGDVDGDGRDEVVVVSNNKMTVLRYVNGDFNFLYSHDLGGGLKVHAVNLADLNGNGVMEAYISASAGDRAESRIVERRNHAAEPFYVTSVGYYLRPVAVPGKGSVLLGQAGGSGGPLREPIYRFVTEGNHAPQPAEKLSLPKGINVFNFNWVDLDNNGQIEIVSIDGQDKLNVFSADGERIWVSAEEYGRRGDYLGADLARVENAIERDLVYPPSRMVIKDINKDGRADIIVGDNLQTSPIAMKHSRTFDNGVLVALSWAGSGMKRLWRSSLVKGYVAGYQYRAAANALGEAGEGDGAGAEPGLFVCKLDKGGLMGILGPSTRSKVVYYPRVFE